MRKLGYTFDVTFNSGETQRRTLSSLDYTVTGGDIAQPGTVTLSVSGSDLCAPVEVSFSVTAVAPASIAVTAPDGLTIAQGGDINALKKQLIVYVLNNDGSYYNNGSPIGDYTLEGDVSRSARRRLLCGMHMATRLSPIRLTSTSYCPRAN